MNKSGSRYYRSIYENNTVVADLSSFDNKKGGHPALNNNLFYYNNNNTNSISVTTITNSNNALQQAPLSYNNNCTSTSPGTSEEYLTNESLSHYMNIPIEDDLAARALVFPPNSNQQQQQQQMMDPVHIHAALGPRSFETPMYTATATSSVAAVPTTPPATPITMMGDTTQNTYYGTFETPFPAATLQPFQDPRFFTPVQQQPPPMWAPQPHDAVVTAHFNNSLDATSQNQLRPQQQLLQHYHPHTLPYTHHLHPHQHQELSTGVPPHFQSDPSFYPPLPLPMTSPFTEVDDSITSQGTFSSTSSSFSSSSSEDEDEENEEDVKSETPSTPFSFPTKAPTHRKKPTKRRAPSTAAALKIAPVSKHPKHPKPVKTSKVNKPNIAKPPGKLHQCQECGRLFTRACNLQSHQTTHLRQKPYPCPDCRMAFARVYDMKRHHRIHSNVRPYQCAMCPEAFKRIEARERHYSARHGYPSQEA
ncbi:hypothetical protein EC957_011919 [Mortierella hygrophila]|uniref:C2H2-type domain-containing protein n=1 Tax=Mortierella hygrophila TaxID=979708 RepID=A0A9P6F8X0_9FUNG|nr:hypothetical protein EC957_011919 [Mortierella hygrophila]